MPKFKIGDWVRVNNGGIYTRYIYRVEKYIEDYGDYWLKDFKISLKEIQLELWKPQEGEWCWFCNGGHVVLARLSRIENDEFITMDTDMLGNCYYKYCAPFIGELPNFLRED